jgi:HEAT repeat protein
MRYLIGLLFTVQLAYSAEAWLFLKDGSVVLGDPLAETISVTAPDGSVIKVPKADVRFQRTREQVDQAVTSMVADIVRGEKTEEHTKRFAVMKCAATPKLLEILKNPNPKFRLTALFALQYGWAPQALEPVTKALEDADPDVQRTAFRVLSHNLPEEKLAKLVGPLADDEDLATAALVFEVADKNNPDLSLKRIKRLLHDPANRAAVLTRISHYRTAELTNDTLAFLDSPDANQRRGGVVGLISQLANGEAVRQRMQKLLSDKDPDIREIAAEYFTWLGQRDDLPALKSTLSSETDAYTRAALDAAVKTTELRAAAWTKNPALASQVEALRSADVMEPTFVYNVGEHARKDEFRARDFKMQEILSAPAGNLELSREFLRESAYPAATVWVPPIRDYYDASRKSFGYCVTKDFTAFVGSVHIGDDCGWRKELRSVCATAPGIVRSAAHVYSWGFIVTIEHKLPNGEPYCSLYAHLSPFLHVKPGDVVAAGQKIASGAIIPWKTAATVHTAISEFTRARMARATGSTATSVRKTGPAAPTAGSIRRNF